MFRVARAIGDLATDPVFQSFEIAEMILATGFDRKFGIHPVEQECDGFFPQFFLVLEVVPDQRVIDAHLGCDLAHAGRIEPFFGEDFQGRVQDLTPGFQALFLTLVQGWFGIHEPSATPCRDAGNDPVALLSASSRTVSRCMAPVNG